MEVGGLVLAALSITYELTSRIYTYTRDVKGAQTTIQGLSSELFSLIGVLEYIRPPVQPDLGEKGGGDGLENPARLLSTQPAFKRVLEETLTFLQDLYRSLEIPKNRLASVVQKLKWPLKEEETRRHLERIERVKSFFVLAVSSDDLDLSKQIASQVSALAMRMDQDRQERQDEKLSAKRRQIIRWLSPVDPAQTRARTSHARTPGSGQWFLNSDSFQEWISSERSACFWLNGITGAGKTTLMTTATEALLHSEPSQAGVAYFYCSFDDSQSQSLSTILGSILVQLLGVHAQIPPKLETMYEATQQTTSIKPSKPTPKDLLDLIRQHVQSFRETFIFVDAINESENPLEIVEMLGRLLDHSGQRSVRVFISSINEKGIEKAVQCLPNLHTETLGASDIQKDVYLLVHSSLESHPRLKTFTPSMKTSIAQALTVNAQGMFRWVQCQLDLLSKVRTPSALSEALASLPTTLAATYESLLLQIDGEEDQRLAREILQVLAFSLRPVTLLEISEYLQVTTSLPYQDRSKQLLDPKDVLSICGSLLNFDPDTGVVALAHHSVLTYLTSELQGDVRRFYLGEREGHSALAKKCLAYLSFDEFAHQSPWMHPRLETFPFLDYAGTFWAQHASRLDSLDDELWAVMKTFLRSNELGRTNFMAWVRQLLPHASWKSIQDTPPLYYAASYGLTIVAEYLLDVGADIEGRGGRSSATPLNIASFRRQVPMVKLLLARGANPRYPDAEGLSAIDWAKARGYTEILSLLRSAK